MTTRFGRALLPMALLFAPVAFAQEPPRLLSGPEAFGGWRDDAPGVRRLMKPSDMPQPFASESTSNRAGKVAMPRDAQPKLPPGFSAALIASGLESPRIVRAAPNGDLFVANSSAGEVLVFRLGKDGKPAERGVFASGLSRPYGIAFYPPGEDPQWVYVANSGSVVRFPYGSGDLKAAGDAEIVVRDLPTGGHWTRDIAFSPDGATMYVSVGSQGNVAAGMGDEPPGGMRAWASGKPLGAAWGSDLRRANVLAFDPQGGNERVFATGLRNCSGLTVQPGTGALWCAVNERDGLGDDLPFEYATTVREGAFYGWPWYYIGDNEDPRHAEARPDLAGKATVPDVLIQPHSAPLGIAFYEGNAFPPEYRDDAFVALHGSWNRGTRTGYKVVRMIFEGGKPTGAYEDFMTGFVVSDDEVWGRPVGVATAHDGALIVTEDGSGSIWRVTYDGD